MSIPIRNLYYLLSYVWDVKWEMEWSTLDAEKSNDALNLLAKILVISTDRLIRRGLDRGYQNKSEELYGVRGRIDIARTIKRNGFSSSRLTCNFEELDHSVIHNQIIRTTLENLTKARELDKVLREEVHDLLHRLRSIDPIPLTPNTFSKVCFHSNIRNYRIPISACRLIYDQLLPVAGTGEYKFVDLSDEKIFRIFEKFLFNFYTRHINQTSYTTVKKERFDWQEVTFEVGTDNLLPSMETDVSLINDTSRLVIECKYYKSALQSHFRSDDENSGSFISGHIYQLYAYLKNLKVKYGIQTSGMIIYPHNGRKIDSTYIIQGHRVSIKTINLDMSPSEIHEELLSNLKLPTQVRSAVTDLF